MENLKVGVGVGVLVLNENNQVLLGLRNKDKVKAGSSLRGEGTWTMPGGKLRYQESFEQAGIRETKEETDLDITNIEVFCFQNDINEYAHYVTIGLKANAYNGIVKTMEPETITKWQWFDLDNLPENMYFPSAKCIEKYKEKIFYK